MFCHKSVTFPNLPSLCQSLSRWRSGRTLWFPAQRWCHMTQLHARLRILDRNQRNRIWPSCPQSMTSSNESKDKGLESVATWETLKGRFKSERWAEISNGWFKWLDLLLVCLQRQEKDCLLTVLIWFVIYKINSSVSKCAAAPCL